MLSVKLKIMDYTMLKFYVNRYFPIRYKCKCLTPISIPSSFQHTHFLFYPSPIHSKGIYYDHQQTRQVPSTASERVSQPDAPAGT